MLRQRKTLPSSSIKTLPSPPKNKLTSTSFRVGYFTIAIILTVLILYIAVIECIMLYRSSFHMDTNLLCDDNNPCTVDIHESIGGNRNPHCSYYSAINTKQCTSSCVSLGVCTDNECVGVCNGVCNVSADCGRLSAVDVTQFANWTDGVSNQFAITRTCVFGTCIYNISLTYESHTFIPNNKTIYVGGSYSSSEHTPFEYHSDYPSKSLVYSSICLAMLNDLECIDAYLTDLSFSNNVTILKCVYMYSCTIASSYIFSDDTIIIYDS